VQDLKQLRYDKAYLRMAKEWGKLSHCKRKQVGAIIVEGYTKWYVLHAEANAILKVASSTQSCKGATLYITLSPCKECSKLIHQAGFVRVVYSEAYKDDSGLNFLKKAGVKLDLIKEVEA